MSEKNIYDIAVIGGGIHGVGVAQAAAAAGYKVVLLEQSSLAAGTSSRSSKLIHGGLRYLESYQFSLVRKSIVEREILLNIAPDLVQRVPFYIPIYAKTTRRPWKIRAGLSLYALLGGLKKTVRFQRIPAQQWDHLDGLQTTGLQAVFCYSDAQTDDAALTRAVMQSAIELGAELLCPARFVQAHFSHDRFELEYWQNEKTNSLQTRCVVNAAGPWVNQVLHYIEPEVNRLEIDLVQGAHVILDYPLQRGVYYAESAVDKRAVFVMPWKDKTLVGTTETVFHGDPGAVQPLANEIEYLCQVWRDYFPDHQANLLSSFAGLRVLPQSVKGASTTMFHRPRDIVIYSDASTPGLVTLYGGKLTGYRDTADIVMRRLAPLLPTKKPLADTKKLHLSPMSVMNPVID